MKTLFKDIEVGTYFTIGNGRTGYKKTSQHAAVLMTNTGCLKIVFLGAQVKPFVPHPSNVR